jgi:hypothetical protein
MLAALGTTPSATIGTTKCERRRIAASNTGALRFESDMAGARTAYERHYGAGDLSATHNASLAALSIARAVASTATAPWKAAPSVSVSGDLGATRSALRAARRDEGFSIGGSKNFPAGASIGAAAAAAASLNHRAASSSFSPAAAVTRGGNSVPSLTLRSGSTAPMIVSTGPSGQGNSARPRPRGELLRTMTTANDRVLATSPVTSIVIGASVTVDHCRQSLAQRAAAGSGRTGRIENNIQGGNPLPAPVPRPTPKGLRSSHVISESLTQSHTTMAATAVSSQRCLSSAVLVPRIPRIHQPVPVDATLAPLPNVEYAVHRNVQPARSASAALRAPPLQPVAWRLGTSEAPAPPKLEQLPRNNRAATQGDSD